jgi:hypothetical protein
VRRPTLPGGIMEHRCCAPGCTEWGSFGYGLKVLDGDPRKARWYCAAHRPEEGKAP